MFGLLAALALVASGCAPALAQAPEKSTAHAITVIGQGTASANPGLALANLGVETLAPTVAEAVAQNSARMDAILPKLRALNIPDKDVQTSGFGSHSVDWGMPKATAESLSSTQYRIE